MKKRLFHKKVHKKINDVYGKILIGICLVFAIAVILFPIKGTPIIQQVQFVRNTTQMDGVHGAANNQRDYLFNDSSNTSTSNNYTTQNTNTSNPNNYTTNNATTDNHNYTNTSAYTGQLYTGTLLVSTGQSITGTLSQLQTNSGTTSQESGTLLTSGTIPQTGNILQTGGIVPKNYSPLIEVMQESFNKLLGTSGMVFQGMIILSGTSQPALQTGKDCLTPRGDTIKHNDFVLAYQQRTDVNNICNIEKRLCTDGTLEGSYTQRSCKEDVKYEYQTAPVISYNQEIVDPFIQPGQPSNSGGNFSNQGQLDQTTKATTTWRDTNSPVLPADASVAQTKPAAKASCTTPRGTSVKHGQFVKAYKSSIGLIDVPCETELRPCINGTLKGSFTNKACTFQNMTYNDYIIGNTDITAPTPQDITDNLNGNTAPSVPNNGANNRITTIFGR